MFRFVIVLIVVLTTGCATERRSSDLLRLYVLDCGKLQFTDVSGFGITNDETSVRTMFVPCYLIRHPDGDLLWDAGLDPALVGQGEVEPIAGMKMSYTTSIIDQLAEIAVQPDDIDLIAISHMHFDHVGAGYLFPDATLLIQSTEYEGAFVNPASNPAYMVDTYQSLNDNQRRLLDGDADVFGDGSVQIINAPGHTAGHQVLLVKLARTGPLVLSGDLYHFQESRLWRRVPQFNIDREQSLAAMDRVEDIVTREGATLWIGHDQALANKLRLAPAFYR